MYINWVWGMAQVHWTCWATSNPLKTFRSYRFVSQIAFGKDRFAPHHLSLSTIPVTTFGSQLNKTKCHLSKVWFKEWKWTISSLKRSNQEIMPFSLHHIPLPLQHLHNHIDAFWNSKKQKEIKKKIIIKLITKRKLVKGKKEIKLKIKKEKRKRGKAMLCYI